MPENEAESEATKPTRDPSIDAIRGVGILTVLLHHWSGNAGRLFAVPHSTTSAILQWVNSFTTFSVPLFLTVSCILAAKSLERNPSALEFYKRRLPGIVHPYLVWTVIAWGALLITSPEARHLSHGIPAYFTHPQTLLRDLLWGKAAFHLYFLVVLIQSMIAMPFIYRLLRPLVKWTQLAKPEKSRPLWVYLVLTALGTAFVLVAQHYVLRLPFPASTFIWYPSALLYFVLSSSPQTGGVTSFVRMMFPIVAMSYLRSLTLKATEWYLENAILACFCGFAVLLIVETGPILGRSKLLVWLGKNSLQIYLVHVFVLEFLSMPRIHAHLNFGLVGAVLVFGLMVGITLGLIELFRVLKIEKLLFGRAG